MRLEAEVFDVMTRWIERYRREAEQRYQRLDVVLAAMDDSTSTEAGIPSEQDCFSDEETS